MSAAPLQPLHGMAAPPATHYTVRRLRRSHFVRNRFDRASLAMLQHTAFATEDARYEAPREQALRANITTWGQTCEAHFDARAAHQDGIPYSQVWLAFAVDSPEDALSEPLTKRARLVGVVASEEPEAVEPGESTPPPAELAALAERRRFIYVDVTVLAVLPAHQGQGCGRRLLDAVAREMFVVDEGGGDDDASPRPVCVLVVNVDPVAHPSARTFYIEHYGFRPWRATTLLGRHHDTLYKRVTRAAYDVDFDDADADGGDDTESDSDSDHGSRRPLVKAARRRQGGATVHDPARMDISIGTEAATDQRVCVHCGRAATHRERTTARTPFCGSRCQRAYHDAKSGSV